VKKQEWGIVCFAQEKPVSIAALVVETITLNAIVSMMFAPDIYLDQRKLISTDFQQTQ
jgi:hypothetical protein